MPDYLRKIPFTEELLPVVQDFECGGDDWERPLAAWIKAGPQVANGALYEMRKRKGKLQVWLHGNQGDDLVGYSSLGESNWRWPLSKDPRVPIMIIPNVAIQTRYQGKPEDGPRYSTQIFDHLVFEARKYIAEKKDKKNIHPLLGLYVDPRNARAKKAYEKAHFRPYFQESEEDGVKYVSYLLKLSDYPEPARPPAGGQV